MKRLQFTLRVTHGEAPLEGIHEVSSAAFPLAHPSAKPPVSQQGWDAIEGKSKGPLKLDKVGLRGNFLLLLQNDGIDKLCLYSRPIVNPSE